MQEQSLKEQLNAYKALREVAQQHKEQIQSHHLSNIEEELQCLELSVEFNMKLEHAGYKQYTVPRSYDNWSRVIFYSNSRDDIIGCSDDGQQPSDEWLYVVQFPTGAYIFGNYFKDEYPTETFDKFFGELKSFGAKYSDTMNSALYFTKDTAHKVHASFWEIFKKYKAMCQEEYNEKRVKKLEAELAELKGN